MNIGNYCNQLSKAIQYKRYSKNTEESYVAQIIKFLKHFESVATKPSEISAKQIKDYLSDIPNTASHRAALCAIKFFYKEVGNQPCKLDRVEYPHKQIPYVMGYSIRVVWHKFATPFYFKYSYKNILWIHWSVEKVYGHRVGEIVYRNEE